MSLAPRRMMPSHSWSVPGRKPGTSTKVSTGTLKASQVRTKRAAFSEASMSRVPANCMGLFATTPTERPSTRPNPVMMFGAKSGETSRNSPSSSTFSMTACMSYGTLGLSGMTVSRKRSSSVTSRSFSSPKTGGSSMLLLGR